MIVMACNAIVNTFQKAVFWDYRATNNVFLMVSQIHSDKKNKWQTGLHNKECVVPSRLGQWVRTRTVTVTYLARL